MSLINKLQILSWAIEAISPEYSEDAVEFIKEEIIPDVREILNKLEDR